MIRNLFLLLLFIGLPKTNIIAQIQDKIDFETANVGIEIYPEEKKINGSVAYTFSILNTVDSVFLDAKSMIFLNVQLNGKKVKYTNNDTHLIIHKNFKKGSNHYLTIQYTALPEQTVYFVNYNDDVQGNEQVWTQGQGKYTSHWLPSFDNMNEKVEFDMNITFDSTYQVVANGRLVKIKTNKNKTSTWSFDMEKPMSSYLLAFAIGIYDKEKITSSSGIPIDLYFYPQDSLMVEPTYRYTKAIFDFLENEIEVPYPWKNYQQIPVKDFLYAGMENTTATIFSDGYVIDSTAFIDKNYVNVNAHELAHQWFGNMLTEVDGNHHWLQEGFATYYALLAEKEIFGDDYFYFKLYDTAKKLQVMTLDLKGESLKNAKASSLTFYEKGAWALVMLKNQIGETAFKKGIKSYLEKYQYKNVTIENFIFEMEQASGQNLVDFEATWLIGSNFPMKEVASYLKNNSESLAIYFKLQENLKSELLDEEKLKILSETYFTSNSILLKKQLILTYFDLFSEDFYKKAFLSKEVEIRQALVLVMDKIPANLKEEYESLLFDKSYITIESALYKLWGSFPQDRKKYLNTTSTIIGLPNKNVRLLWLTLAIATENYNGFKTKEYFDELSAYTGSEYSIDTRQTTFEYLYQTLGLTDKNLIDLANATVHHSWQFKSFARNLVEELLKDTDYKNRITALLSKLNVEEQRYIKSKLY